jgi:hypothetical protein
MAGDPQATPKPGNSNDAALPVMMTEQAHKDGVWMDSWEHIYSYGKVGPQPSNDVTQYNRNGQWKNAYYSYSYDNEGAVVETLGERHYSDAWVKSAERRCGDAVGREVLEGWPEGKNDWTAIYTINTKRNDVGLVTRQQYHEHNVKVGLGDVPLLTFDTEYDSQNRVVAVTAAVAVKKDGQWETQPSSRRIYEYTSAK